MTEQHEVLDGLDTFDALDFPGADILAAAGEVTPPGAGTIDAALAAVRLAAAGEGAATDSKWPRRRFAGTRRSRILLSAAAVAAVVAGAIAVPTIPFGDTPPAAGANAASFLHGVADTAAEAPSTDAPYWKVSQKSVSIHDTASPTTVWLSRSGMITKRKGRYVFVAAGKAPDAQMAWDVADGGVNWDDLPKLPTEPDALKAYLLSGKPTKTPKNEVVFRGIVTLLEAPVSSEVRAALYDLLARLPYLRLVGPVHDSAGRSGVAIEFDGQTTRSRIVIDPKTAMPLERQNSTLGGPADGQVYLTTTYVSLESVWTAPKAEPAEEHRVDSRGRGGTLVKVPGGSIHVLDPDSLKKKR
ncbi:CU044_5270 family protein [Streptomyces sp. NPDC002680]|uniref:CU044_5270 family protein n=1 Tax=Streptomyces sp. NPDC002680 TaxID=3364659 RepID=UPI0036D0B4B5